VPLVDADPWPDHPMPIPKSPADPRRPDAADGQPPTFVNTETHWWDGSALYGTNLDHQKKVRSGTDGKLHLGPNSLLVLSGRLRVFLDVTAKLQSPRTRTTFIAPWGPQLRGLGGASVPRTARGPN
jgi:hypothetical protein